MAVPAWGQDAPPHETAAPDGSLGVVTLVLALLSPVIVWVLWRRGVVRPGSLLRRGGRGPRSLGGVPWWMLAGGAFLVLVGGVIGVSIAAAAAGRDVESALAMASVQGAGAAASIVTGLILMIALRSARAIEVGGSEPTSMLPQPPEGFDPFPTPRDLWRTLLGFAATLPLYAAASILLTLLARLVTGGWPDDVAHDTLRDIMAQRGQWSAWVMILVAVVLAPISEEIMFRVFLQSGLVAATQRPWLAIVLTSVLFASLHLHAVPWHAAATLFVLSLAWGVAYEWTGRAAVPMLMHAAFNAMNIGMLLLG